MLIEFDEVKRAKTLADRGLDFARAGEVFDGAHVTAEDLREGYPEPRCLTAGWLDGEWLSWCGRLAARCAASSR